MKTVEINKFKKEFMDNSELSVHKALSSVKRARILELISTASKPLSAEDISDALKIHVNTVRSHLSILVEADLIDQLTLQESRPGRPTVSYVSKKEEPDLPSSYGLLTSVLISELATKPYGKEFALNAGKQWGKYFTPQVKPGTVVDSEREVQVLTDVLNELGFEPSINDEVADIDSSARNDDKTSDDLVGVISVTESINSYKTESTRNRQKVITLKRCPFKKAAQENSDIVCRIHLGIVNGVLENLGINPVGTQLTPFVGPSECILELNDTLSTEIDYKEPNKSVIKYTSDSSNDIKWALKKKDPRKKSSSNTKIRRIKKMEPFELDVRPILAKGEEPFGLIMETVSTLEENQDLILYAPFDPIPLEGVMTEKGYDFESDPVGGGDFKVRFFKP
jgi:predicted ArsR family transcriptional regulator/uncharacterized protein (DUF2249 family)